MFRYLLLASSALLAACTNTSHAPYQPAETQPFYVFDNRGYEKSPHTDRGFANNSEEFQFVIISDNTGGARPGVLKNALRKVNLLQPEFVVSIGDLIEGYTEQETEIASQWAEFDSFLEELEMRFFYTPGNHDWSNEEMGQYWKDNYGASTYHFIYNDTLFLVLNTEEDTPGGLRPGITQEQLDYLTGILDANKDVRWTFVLMHEPLWAMGEPKNWKALETHLASRDYSAFAGHMHVYDYQQSASGKDHITLGTTGGYNLLRGKIHGEFDHVTWITMTQKGPKIANLSLSGIDDKYVIPQDVRKTFHESPVFTASPWIAKEGESSTTIPLTLRNSFNYPLTYSVDIFASSDIHFDETLPKGTLAPGETLELPLPLTATSTVNPEPLIIKAHAELAVEAGNPVSWNQSFRLAPVVPETFSRAASPIIFDGKLDDWPALPFSSRAEGSLDDGTKISPSPENASFRFGVQYDDTYLYVGVEVTDDEVASAGLTDKLKSRDFAVVTLDARSAEESAGNPGQIAEMKHGTWLMMMAAPKGEEGELLFSDFSPASFAAKVVQHKDGYTAEYRLPLEYVISMQGADWKDLRLNVAINDIDPSKSEPSPVLLNWKEQWDSAVLGSGLMQRHDN